jgi:hypothetical protein
MREGEGGEAYSELLFMISIRHHHVIVLGSDYAISCAYAKVNLVLTENSSYLISVAQIRPSKPLLPTTVRLHFHIAMADVRSLLQIERSSRQQTSTKPKKPQITSIPISPKKRKAPVDEHIDRKRVRAADEDNIQSRNFNEDKKHIHEPSIAQGNSPEERLLTNTHLRVEQADQSVSPQYGENVQDESARSQQPRTRPPQDEVDEDEWAAFEREIAEVQEVHNTIATLDAAAAITAAPKTAEELAAKAMEQETTHRSERQKDIEAEREDAERDLEQQFEEMEQLEERVRKLREQREALRNTQRDQSAEKTPSPTKPADDLEDSSDMEEEDEWDSWRFLGT